jgi:hypothetical protein
LLELTVTVVLLVDPGEMEAGDGAAAASENIPLTTTIPLTVTFTTAD